jgi:hypothetical protein
MGISMAESIKKLRKQARILEYRVRILEDEQRIRELEQQQKEHASIGFCKRDIKPSLGEHVGAHIYDDTYIEEGVTIMGGKPKPGGKPDKRLKENRPPMPPKPKTGK